MKNKPLRSILVDTPEELRIEVRRSSDIAVRVHKLLEEKQMTQKELADRLGKKPSEISKWLSGTHNLTLRTIAKLEAVLGEAILAVPRR
jgi:ribosome-binding protein aMBF1 (putative translation factor)